MYEQVNIPLQGELTTGKWQETVESLQFADFKFLVSRYCLTETGDGVQQSTDGSTDGATGKETSVSANTEEEQGSGESGQSEIEEDGDKGLSPLSINSSCKVLFYIEQSSHLLTCEMNEL